MRKPTATEGTAKDELGHFEGAISDYDQAIRLDPEYANAYNNRGNAKSDLGKHFEAISDYDQAIRLAPNHAEVLLQSRKRQKSTGTPRGCYFRL